MCELHHKLSFKSLVSSRVITCEVLIPVVSRPALISWPASAPAAALLQPAAGHTWHQGFYTLRLRHLLDSTRCLYCRRMTLPYSSWATHTWALERHGIVVEEAVVVIVVVVVLLHDVAAIDRLGLRSATHFTSVATRWRWSTDQERCHQVLITMLCFNTKEFLMRIVYNSLAYREPLEDSFRFSFP